MQAALRPRMTITAPLLRGCGELHIVASDDVHTIADPDGAIHRLVELADGSRSTDELFSELAADYPLLDQQDVLDAVCELESVGLLEDYAERRRARERRRDAGRLRRP